MVSPSTDRRYGLNSSAAIKVPVVVATTGNTTLNGLQTIDGVALSQGDRVLVLYQTNSAENGIYVADSGIWSRDVDFSRSNDVIEGTVVKVLHGTSTGWWGQTAANPIIGSSAIQFARDLISSASTISFTQVGSAVARAVSAKLQDSVSILDFIPVAEHAAIRAGTSTYDCYADIMTAINSFTVGTGFYISGPAIYFPPGTYKCNTTIELKKRVTLWGDGSGLPSGEQAIIVFPANTKGIIVHRYNTTGSTTEGSPTTAGDGSQIFGLKLQGSGGSDTTAHGIWCRARACIHKIQVDGFKGKGIQVLATSGAGGALEGNANGTYIGHARITSNGSHGVFFSGADANAGLTVALDCAINGGWALYDSSFLGNIHLAPQAEGNTLGGFKADSANARALFLGPYSESGQPPSDVIPPSQIIGGLGAAGVTAATLGTLFGGLNGMVAGAIDFASKDGNADVQFGKGATNEEFAVFTRAGSQLWRLKSAVGRIYADWANSAGAEFLQLLDRDQVSTANGYVRNLAESFPTGAPIGLPLGYLDVGLRARVTSTSLSTAPVIGDVYTNPHPLPGGYMAQTYTTAGWKGFGLIST